MSIHSSKFIIISLATLGLAGCSWYNALDENGNNLNVKLANYSETNDQTEHNSRGLHRRIGMRALRNRHTPVNRTAPAAVLLQPYAPEAQGMTSLAEAKQNATNAVANIDQMIESLEQVMLPQDINIDTVQIDAEQADTATKKQVTVLKPFVPTPEEAAYAPVPGEIPAPYNYTVVYTYSAPEPRDEMWVQLEESGEQDKWRGVNRRKPAWFIYVGAYYSKHDAIQRQQMLLSMVGSNPELRNRAQNHTVAAK